MYEFEPLIPNDASSLLRSERMRYSNVEEYLDAIVAIDGDNPWLKHMKDMAFLVEPKDPVLGVDPEYTAGNAFYRGSLIGFRVVKACGMPDLENKMLQVNVGIRSNERDWNSRLEKVANSILSCGEQGAHLSLDLYELIQDWEDDLEPKVKYQPYVRRGFGVMMYMMHEAIDMLITESMEKAASSGVDWDQELRGLTGEN